MARKKAGAVAGSPEGAGRASAGEPAPLGGGGRFSSRCKREVVLRVLRGETLDAVSRSLGVTATLRNRDAPVQATAPTLRTSELFGKGGLTARNGKL